MRRKTFLLGFIFLFLLTGCTTYTLRKEKEGFAVARYQKVIPEYTLGLEDKFPSEEEIAWVRFQRRKKTVEDYYKKMGLIENRFKEIFLDPPFTFLQFTAGILRFPFLALSDYRYHHNPTYQRKIDQKEEEGYEFQKAKLKKLKEELNTYLKDDLAEESLVKEKKEPVVLASKTKVAERPKVVLSQAVPSKRIAGERNPPKKIKTKEAILAEELTGPKAVIIAQPQRGPSPLKVKFNATKSSSSNGKIIYYEWDFGDGDKSNKPKPTNTFWSTTYGKREFLVTLKVTDSKGLSSSASTVIEVINNQ